MSLIFVSFSKILGPASGFFLFFFFIQECRRTKSQTKFKLNNKKETKIGFGISVFCTQLIQYTSYTDVAQRENDVEGVERSIKVETLVLIVIQG